MAGLVLLWVSGLYSVTLEGGDCGGSAEDCVAAAALGREHVRLMVAMLLATTTIGIGVLRNGHPLARAALLMSAAIVGMLGMWGLVAPASAPAWLPIGWMVTLPAAMVICVGVALPSLRSRTRPGA